jgi:excisionase family DNA binding protein
VSPTFDPTPLRAEQLLTVTEVAKVLNVSKNWVREHSSGRARPYLRSIRFGRNIRFHEDDVRQFIEECRVLMTAVTRRRAA